MKKFILILIAWLALALSASATTVTVNPQSLSGFQATNIGSDVALTLSVTNGSAAVTCSACLRTQWVGLSGFRLGISGVDYTVSSVNTTSSLTLTSNYLGSTSGSASSTMYKYVEIRFYSSIAFIPLGSSSIIQSGTPGSGAFFKRIVAGVTQSTLYIPSFTIDSTVDSVDNNTARYTLGIYRTDGSLIQYYACSPNLVQLRIPATTPTTLGAICTFNSAPTISQPNTYYSTGQIDQRFPSCGNGLTYVFSGGAITCGSLVVADPLVVKEVDGTPTVTGVTTIRVQNGTLTQDSATQVTLTATVGPGTLNKIPVFTSSIAVGDSILTQSTGTITVAGGYAEGLTTISTSNVTIPSTAAMAFIDASAAGSVLNVFLPDCTSITGKRISVKRIDQNSGRNVHVLTTSGQSIETVQGRPLMVPFATIVFQSNGTKWVVVGEY